MNSNLILITCAAFLSFTGNDEARTWKDATGKFSVEARFVGPECNVPVSQLRIEYNHEGRVYRGRSSSAKRSIRPPGTRRCNADRGRSASLILRFRLSLLREPPRPRGGPPISASFSRRFLS